MNSRKRITYLDIAKGFAIMAVIIGHTTWAPEKLVWFLFTWHLPLFFLVAGFTFRPKTTRQILEGSAKRLLLPYLVICLVLAVRLSVTGGIGVLGSRIVATLFAYSGPHPWVKISPQVPSVGSIWFLPAMFWCRVAFNWIVRFRYKYLWAFLIAVIATFVGFYWIVLPFSILEGLSALTFFSIGHFANQYQTELKTVKYWLLPVGLLCWCWQFSHPQISMAICRYVCYPIDVIGACFATWCIIVISKWMSQYYRISFIVLWFGINSLTVLCMHNLESYGINYARLDLPLDSFSIVVIRMLIVMASTIILSYWGIARSVFGLKRFSEVCFSTE